MSAEKPLHVRVAEALGWKNCHPACEIWWGLTPNGDIRGVTRYDTDWSATGPLIEKCSVNVLRNSRLGSGPAWKAQWDDNPRYHELADKPLVAVCNLILALKEAGRL